METGITHWLWSAAMKDLWLTLVILAAIQGAVALGKHTIRTRVADMDRRYKLRKALQVLGFAAMALPVAVIYRARLGGLNLVLGFAGAGFAFALQEVIASLAGWAAITAGGFYEVGDRVQIGAIKGDVIDIGPLRTTLMEMGSWVDGDNYNGRIVRNNLVFKEPVFNYNGDFPYLWDEIKLPVRYGCDHRYVLAELEAIANKVVGSHAEGAEAAWRELVQKFRVESARTSPVVTLVATDNWMQFTVRYVVAFKGRRNTKSLLFLAILDAVAASEQRFQLASTTMELVNLPPVRVTTT